MFWIGFFGLTLTWLLTKLGFLSATVGILTMVIKLLIAAIVLGSIAAAWYFLRSKVTAAADKK